MGCLKNAHSEQSIVLRSHHIVGRHPDSSHTVMANATVSRCHCLLEWQADAWYIQDISANGTFINGKRVAKNIKHPLSLSDQIQFGDPSSEAWQVTNLTKPSAFFMALDGHNSDIEVGQYSCLIKDEQHDVIVSQTLSGQWLLEKEGHVEALMHQQRIELNGTSYLFIAPDELGATQTCSFNENADVCLDLTVSQNEEHVGLVANVNGHVFDLGDRTHHYLVLLLARKYLEDQSAQVAETEQGWVDKSLLIKDSGMEESHINTQFYRFRKKLLEAAKGLNLNVDIIERRRGEVRINCDQVTIQTVKVA